MAEHSDNKQKILKDIIRESRHRPVIPFIGSGVSISAGYPTIRTVTQYLAKVSFSIQQGIFQDRFPIVKGGKKELVKIYRQHPSKYLEDFGWPNLGQLDADLWNWLELKLKSEQEFSSSDKYCFSSDFKDFTYKIGNEEKTIKQLDYRDYLNSIVQWTLRQELAQHEEGTKQATLDEWIKWKKWYHTPIKERENYSDGSPKLLFGDWEMLLDKLCEGNFDLTDTLFNQFEKGLNPALSHRLLAFLQPKLGIPLVFTTNFDSLLETAFRGEGLRPAVFDVHRDAQLPTPDLVQKQLSVLKLHGSAYGLRFGERLKQQLKTDAENSAKQYLPKNALILVLGFSGSERRMMQMLQAFVQNSDPGSDAVQLFWIQGPSKPGPLFDELEKSGKVIRCDVMHADTFLQELYFNIANSHQSSSKNYSSLPGQLRMTELEMTAPKEKENIEKELSRRPVQCFIDSSSKENPSGSWATLAGVAFTNSLDPSYVIIWIDLENFQTVQGVIAEFFNKVRIVDPFAPNCNVSDFSNDNKVEKDEIVKISERIKEVFQRGRYVLVLDSLESFGRPSMVHHGIPTHENNPHSPKSLKQTFIGRVDNFYDLLKELLILEYTSEAKEKYRDSYIVITIDKTHSRHPDKKGTPKNEALGELNIKISELKKSLKKKEHIRLFENNEPKYTTLNSNLKDLLKADSIDSIPDKEKFSECWLYNGERKIERSLERAKHTFLFLKDLSSKSAIPLQENGNDEKFAQNSISLLVCLLAFFRQPRTIPMLHSIIQRWVLRDITIFNNKGNSDQTESKISEQEKEEQVHLIIKRLLSLITAKNEAIKSTKEENIHFHSVQSVGIKLGNIPRKWAPTIAQKHEGGSIWLYREVHESTYNAQTEYLHRHDWIEGNIKGDNGAVAALIDGMTFISWHLLIARTYYVDIFLPTKDIKAFYEYLYHRVTAIRTITLLLKIVEDCDIKVLCEKLDSIKEEQADCSLLWYAELVGVFSQIPKNQKGLDLRNQQKYKDDKKLKEDFINELKRLHSNSLDTLLAALERNQLTFLAQSTPDTVLAWSTQFLQQELREMKGKDLNLKEELYPDKPQGLNSLDKLEAFFINQRFNARMSKFAFQSIIRSEYDTKIQVDKCIDLLRKESENIKANPHEPTGVEKLNGLVKLIKKCHSYKKSKQALEKPEKFNLECDKFMRITRCLLFLDYRIANTLATIINTDLCPYIPEENKNIKEALERDSIALKGKSLIAQWPLWKPLLDRKLPEKKAGNYEEKSDLETIEEDSIAYEDTLRMTTKTAEDDALHRSSAFSLRARALYLQGHFSQAHHFLDIASTGLILERFDHRTNASTIHLVRSELLATSAEINYAACISNNKDQIPEVNTSLKKLKRAMHGLSQAEVLLRNMAHEKVWLIALEFGIAQVQLEQILFEMELFFLEWSKSSDFRLDKTDYLKKSGALEQSILNGMQRLRDALDLIPFDSRKWDKNRTEKNERYYPTLVKLERMCYMLWKQFFVVGEHYTRLLGNQYKASIKLGGDAISYTELTSYGESQYKKRWEHWCTSMRFPKLSVQMTDSNSLLHKDKKSQYTETETRSLRAVVIREMKEECAFNKINEIWNARR